MSRELASPNQAQEIDPVAPPAVLERIVRQGELVKQDEMEVVTTSSGTILYIPQSLDE